MATPEGKKMLSAAIDASLADQFDVSFAEMGKRFSKQEVFTAFAKWFIALPLEERLRFCEKCRDESFESLVEWMERLVESAVEKYVARLQKGELHPPHELKLKESIANIKYITRYRLFNAKERDELEALMKELGPDLAIKKGKVHRG